MEENSPISDLKMMEEEDCEKEETISVPDGGVRAWFVCITFGLSAGTIFFIINSFTVMYSDFQIQYLPQNVTSREFKTSSVWSLGTGVLFGMSPVASILIDKFGIRQMSFIGGALSCSGMLLTSLMPSYEYLYLTYGVMFGSGVCLINTAGVIIMGHYFKRFLGRANGLAMTGSGCFLIAGPYLHEKSIGSIGLRHHLQLLSVLLAVFMIYAVVWKPTYETRLTETGPSHQHTKEKLKSKTMNLLRGVVQLNIYKNRKFMIWTVGMVIAHFGYFIQFVHLIQYVKLKNSDYDGAGLLTTMSVASVLNRFLTGIVADHPKVSRIILLQFSLALMGCCTALFPLVDHYVGLVVLIFVIGLCDGCLVTLFGPIAFDLVGHQKASQAIGLLMGLVAIPMMTGPSIAGLLFDYMGSYDIIYYLAGIPPLIGANIMFLIHWENKRKLPTQEEEIPLPAS